MLEAIGESPVSTEGSQHPDALVAGNLLDRLSEQLQAPGASYNREYKLTLAVDTATDEVVPPSNTLQVDPFDVNSKLVQRGTRLYDPVNHTFKIGEDVVVNLIAGLGFEELPPEAQHYLAAEGSYRLHLSRVGDEKKLAHLMKLLDDAKRAYGTAELKALDINARNTSTTARMLGRIVPYRRV